MATATLTSRADLITNAKAQWAASEAAVKRAVATGNFAKAGAGTWSAGDTFRHMIDSAYRFSGLVDGLVKGQAMNLTWDQIHAGNAEGVKKFSQLTPRFIEVELNTAHGICWMAMQKLQPVDLEKKVPFAGTEMTIADVVSLLTVAHEQQHVAEALAAAGAA
ncbi:MAG: hypothetical protein ACKVVT_17660 [Dehalococcoidia bacterium]